VSTKPGQLQAEVKEPVMVSPGRAINGGFQASFGFNLDSIPSIAYSAISPAALFTIPGGNPQSSGSLMMDGLGSFQFGLEGVRNPSTPDGSTLPLMSRQPD
jgi:hypothetical protein